MENLTIRSATTKDFTELKRMGKEAWPDWNRENPGFGARYMRDRIKGNKTLIALADGSIVGYMIYGSLWSRHIHLEDIYIKREYRRLGVGSALMGRLIKIARKGGIRKIVAEEEPGNRIAYKYNIKHGFKEAGYVKRLWGTAMRSSSSKR